MYQLQSTDVFDDWLRALQDRKGRALSFDDVKHYQRILKILAETDRIMGTISMTLDVPA